jgi:hypothetical protein
MVLGGLLWHELPARDQLAPYGHNPAAGHYQEVSGARLYYEA